MDRAGAAAEPGRKCPKDERNRSPKGRARGPPCCRSAGLNGLLPRLLRRLTVLLLILLDSVARFLNRNVGCTCEGLGSLIARLLRSSLVACERRPHRRDRAVAQGDGVVAAGGLAHLTLDCAERIGRLRKGRRRGAHGGLRGRGRGTAQAADGAAQPAVEATGDAAER